MLSGLKRNKTSEHLKVLHGFVTALLYYEMEPFNVVVSQAEMDAQYFRTLFCLKKGLLYLIFWMGCGVIKIDGGKQSITVSGHEQVPLLKRQKN